MSPEHTEHTLTVPYSTGNADVVSYLEQTDAGDRGLGVVWSTAVVVRGSVSCLEKTTRSHHTCHPIHHPRGSVR